jgi:exodeoxyribonuclease-3
VLNVYFPNGQEVGSKAFEYKLQWMLALRQYLDARLRPEQPVLLCGDFNVAIDDLDVAHPMQWAASVLCCPPVRGALENIRAWGFTDIFRQHNPEGHIYSWWDYRQLGFPRNDGLRLDHLLASAPLASRCRWARVDREQRKGEKPSDHAPVMCEFADL